MNNKRNTLLVVLLILVAFTSPLVAGGSVTFPVFSTGTITGGGAPVIQALNVSGLPNSEYLIVSVTGNYTPGTSPHDSWSSTLKMEINNGSSTIYWPLSGATFGQLPGAGATTLEWTGILPTSYVGGGNLSIKFQDAFTDASGPYTASLNNVVVTIYPAPAPKKTFATFNTGTITGGGAAVIQALNVSGLPSSQYILVSITGDYAPGTSPHDSWSSTLKMEIDNGGSTVYWPLSGATFGQLPGAGATSLKWTGILPTSYVGGGSLALKFQDAFTDASGPYTASLNNVVATIYPAPVPIKVFPAFNTGTITGGGAAVVQALNVSGLPSAEYLIISVTGDYAPGTSPHDSWSSTLKMEMDNGGSTVYWPLSGATFGQLPGAGATSLKWTGILPKTYVGGGSLALKFQDAFTDASGPYTASLNNVVATIYPVYTAPPGITSALTASGTYGTAISTYTITASNSPTSFGASGLPNGLSVNTSNGQITGTPTTNGTFNVTIGATNLGGSATATLVYTIAKANLTVTGITAKNKPFDGTTAATLNVASAALAGVVTGDSITLNTGGASGTFASSSVGSGKLVTISGLTISGAASGNYTLTQPTTTANITTPMTVSLSAPSTQLTSSGPVTYTVTYTSANTITLGSGGVTLNRTGTANGTVVVSGSGNSTRTVTVTNIIGEGSLGISVAANTATDIDGNPAPAAGPSGTFTVNIPPAVTAQPASQTVPPATNATFSVTGTGTAPLKYQWSKDNVAVVGATNSTFTVTNTARASVGLYSVTLSNAVGLAQSSNALLRVVIPQVFATPIRPVNGTFTWLFRDSTGTVATLDYASNYFQMQASTNLSIWQPISGNLGLTNGWLSFQDSNASLFPNRFYRLRE